MFDFDGTLAPIMSYPQRARLGARTYCILETVARHFPVAIITGRALSDVQARVSISRISFAGNHGLEWSVRGKTRRVPIPPRMQRSLRIIRVRMQSLARRYRGAVLEDKMHTLSLHYRHVLPSNHAAVRAEVKKAARETGNLRLLGGTYIVNILPAVHRDKGTAAREMYVALAGRKRPVPVFVGDDVTDEDAFRALKGGITLRVGESSSSAAQYYVRSRAGVDRLLDALTRYKLARVRR